MRLWPVQSPPSHGRFGVQGGTDDTTGLSATSGSDRTGGGRPARPTSRGPRVLECGGSDAAFPAPRGEAPARRRPSVSKRWRCHRSPQAPAENGWRETGIRKRPNAAGSSPEKLVGRTGNRGMSSRTGGHDRKSRRSRPRRTRGGCRANTIRNGERHAPLDIAGCVRVGRMRVDAVAVRAAGTAGGVSRVVRHVLRPRDVGADEGDHAVQRL